MLEQSGKFRVVSNLGDIFEIVQGRQHNIYKLNAQGVRVEEWCVHVADWTVPNEDNMLAQKLCIETDIEDLYRQANVWCLPQRLMIHAAGSAARVYNPAPEARTAPALELAASAF